MLERRISKTWWVWRVKAEPQVHRRQVQKDSHTVTCGFVDGVRDKLWIFCLFSIFGKSSTDLGFLTQISESLKHSQLVEFSHWFGFSLENQERQHCVVGRSLDFGVREKWVLILPWLSFLHCLSRSWARKDSLVFVYRIWTIIASPLGSW